MTEILKLNIDYSGTAKAPPAAAERACMSVDLGDYLWSVN